MAAKQTTPSLAETFAEWATGLAGDAIPETVRQTLNSAVTDAAGLMIAARATDYVGACLASTEGHGRATAIGHARAFTATDAALISGTAAHGEDFDDTFEGTPVHVGAVVVPAVLAIAETHQRSGRDVLRGLAVGAELSCRLAVVAPTAIHRAGFHPTAVIGALGAAAGVATTLGLTRTQFASAVGIAGSMASGIIEYLAEGTSTKRLHPGWAAQSGIRAARMAAAGFDGPRTVIEGEHGFFKAFADAKIPRDYSRITDGLGGEWLAGRLAFKPYACGTMVQPFIDCAIRLRAQGIDPTGIERITAAVGEGTVHRLWEPRAEKRAPSTPYSAKFSVPYGIAIGLIDGDAGLAQFTHDRIKDPRVTALTALIDYEIDPANEYPANYTGALRVRMRDRRELHLEQPHLRGGVREPLSPSELTAKFHANANFGGWSKGTATEFLAFASGLFNATTLDGLSRFRV